MNNVEIMEPDFGVDIPLEPESCAPSELFLALESEEEHIHFYRPAYVFLRSYLRDVGGGKVIENPDNSASPQGTVAQLVESALEQLELLPHVGAHSKLWGGRLIREFAPVGLADGIWLQGAIRVNVVVSKIGMDLLRQFMIRFGDAHGKPSFAEQYATLLRGTGVTPERVTRQRGACTDLSYEHALFPRALAMFPSCFWPETLGCALWMSAVGPCPLLRSLLGELKEQGLSVTYFDSLQDERLDELGRRAALQFLESATSEERGRLIRGFWTAHNSYVRWDRGMRGPNAPMTPAEFVQELILEKAPFARGYHQNVQLEGENMDAMFSPDREQITRFMEKLVRSEWIAPGAPQQSRLLTHSLSFDGPMFGVFGSQEEAVLAEWIENLTEGGTTTLAAASPQQLVGQYTPAQQHAAVTAYATKQYSNLDSTNFFYRMTNIERYPLIRIRARQFLLELLDRARKFSDAGALGQCPPYSHEALDELVRNKHATNLSLRNASATGTLESAPPITYMFDGIWLQGFADVRSAHLEEFSLLGKIYASEQGDGRLEWNHNHIWRLVRLERGVDTPQPQCRREDYGDTAVPGGILTWAAGSLWTKTLCAELLGMNLANEAGGVGSYLFSSWKAAEKDGNPAWALMNRLHNSIDNFASGHTEWSKAAIKAHMARIQRFAPDSVESEWRKIWRVWQVQQVGTQSKQ
jgi:hypothetical protein